MILGPYGARQDRPGYYDFILWHDWKIFKNWTHIFFTLSQACNLPAIIIISLNFPSIFLSTPADVTKGKRNTKNDEMEVGWGPFPGAMKMKPHFSPLPELAQIWSHNSFDPGPYGARRKELNRPFCWGSITLSRKTTIHQAARGDFSGRLCNDLTKTSGCFPTCRPHIFLFHFNWGPGRLDLIETF